MGFSILVRWHLYIESTSWCIMILLMSWTIVDTIILNHWTWGPRYQASWDQHEAYLGPVGPRWVPCWPHEPCYQGLFLIIDSILSLRSKFECPCFISHKIWSVNIMCNEIIAKCVPCKFASVPSIVHTNVQFGWGHGWVITSHMNIDIFTCPYSNGSHPLHIACWALIQYKDAILTILGSHIVGIRWSYA